MIPFEAIVLGASGTYPKPGGATSGFLLRVGEYTVWMDCGTGTFANLQRHTDFHDLSGVVITHLHLDHILDFYSLYYALKYGKDSRGPTGLEVYAPAGAEAHLAQLLSPTASEDFGGFFDFRAVKNGDKIAILPFVFTFLRTEHPVETLAVRVEANGRSLVYTADTAWKESLVKFAQGANVLIAEATLQEPDAGGQSVHMTAEEAGRLAVDARVKRLVLTHLAPGLDPTVSMDQAARHFRGKILVATDNLSI
ncbi:MAG TPA: MBL fold metallo-hydrolase [Actinomycetota bacterium]|nr:MBL fold metallo-hydrolase [Actinomycetota bacterium]